MNLDGIDKKKLDNFLKEKINREIILKYLFLKAMEEKYEDEYIQTMYKINPTKIRNDYNALNKEEIANMEKNLIAQINAKEINLASEAVRWHREGLSAIRRSEISKKGYETYKAKREEAKREETERDEAER